MSTTLGRWIDLATSGGARDRFRADQPGGAGRLQVAASNATLAARENGLRPLWEDFGNSDVTRDLFVAGDVRSFEWGSEDTDGGYVRLCGVPRVRLYGETASAPRLHLACRALAPSGYSTGIILAVSAGPVAPSMESGSYIATSTSSTTLTDLSLTLTLTPELLAPELLALRTETDAVSEAGVHTQLGVWVGAWCTSGSGMAKGALYGLSVLLREPS